MSYLDTSVLAAYYCPEALSNRVQKAVGEVRDPTISPLVEVEFYSALSLKVRTEALDISTARQAAAMFQVHLTDGLYRIVPIGAGEYALARQWLCGFSSTLRALDALHLAAAFAHALVILTADKSLAQAAEQFGVKHRLIS